MAEVSNIGVFTALLAGVISFLSPCVLPLVPGYLSYVTGQSLDDLERRESARATASALALSGFFVLGFSTVFIALGASATALGQLLLEYRYEANLVGGAIVIVFGLFMIGFLRLPWLQRDLRYQGPLEGGRPVGAYTLGLAFAFGWTPCIGPVLGAILTVSAVSASVSSGVALLAIYSLGLGIPFLALAVFTGRWLKRSRSIARFGRPLQIGAGLIMVVMGVAMMTGQLTAFGFWMLETFPVLGTIG